MTPQKHLRALQARRLPRSATTVTKSVTMLASAERIEDAALVQTIVTDAVVANLTALTVIAEDTQDPDLDLLAAATVTTAEVVAATASPDVTIAVRTAVTTTTATSIATDAPPTTTRTTGDAAPQAPESLPRPSAVPMTIRKSELSNC